jgi:hypothetical protein
MTHSLEGEARSREPCDRTGGGGSVAMKGGSSHAQLSAGQEAVFTARGAWNAVANRHFALISGGRFDDPQIAFTQQIAVAR